APNAIPIVILLSYNVRDLCSNISDSRQLISDLLINHQESAIKNLLASASRRCRRGLLLIALFLLGEQPKIINAGRADIIDHFYDRTVLGASISAHINALVDPIRKPVFNLLRQLVGSDLVIAEEDLTVTHNCDNQRVFF